MVLFDDNVLLIENTTITNFGVEFITTLLYHNTRETLYIIVIYKRPKMQVSHFNFILEYSIQKMPSHCSIVIIEDFNIDFLTKKINHQHYKHL
jgi:hypothetical protein